MIPTPYFSNIPNIGDLTIDYIFAELDCPIIFTCKDKNNKIYFCICVTMENIQKWAITKVDIDCLKNYFNNEISNYEMFVNSPNPIYILTWNYGCKKEDCKIVSSDMISDDDLPPKNTYINADDGEFDDYIQILNNRIEINKESYFGRFIEDSPSVQEPSFKYIYGTDIVISESSKNSIKYAYSCTSSISITPLIDQLRGLDIFLKNTSYRNEKQKSMKYDSEYLQAS